MVIVPEDPEIANVLPEDASWTVSYNDEVTASDVFAADHLQLPAEIVVENPVPRGSYTISIDSGPTFEPIVGQELVVNQSVQVFNLVLMPVVEEEEMHTGIVKVVEADTTSPVVGAEVFIFSSLGDDDDEDTSARLITFVGLQSAGGGIEWRTPFATGITDASGEYAFAGLPDGVYNVAVVAEDGRTATGTLTIAGGDSTSHIVMQAVPDPDPTEPDPSEPGDDSNDDANDDKGGETVTELPSTGIGMGNSTAMMMLAASLAALIMGVGGLMLRKNRM